MTGRITLKSAHGKSSLQSSDECWKKLLEFLPREMVAGDAVNFVRDCEMKVLEVSDVDERRDRNMRRGVGSIEIGLFLEAASYIALVEADNMVLSLRSKGEGACDTSTFNVLQVCRDDNVLYHTIILCTIQYCSVLHEYF